VTSASKDVVVVFAYSSLLRGERDHDLMHRATLLRKTTTPQGYRLVDLGPYGAMIAGGDQVVVGELWELDRETLRAIDVRKEVPVLFERTQITTPDGALAETYVMPWDRVVGRKRLAIGDWKQRFAPKPLRRPRPKWR
jgi:gamma-glutamylcyclotransferase (GGCT)/AIG2-like uncharacterized protein YtfP